MTGPDAALLERRAAECLEAGRTVEALRHLDRIIELGAATAATWQRTADALASLGEYAQAVGAFGHSLEQDPQQAAVHHELGSALYQLGDVAPARKHLERAAALSDSLAPWIALATMAPGCPSFGPAEILSLRRELARRMSAVWPAPAPRPARRRRDGSLRVAYLSAHFHQSNYMKPVWGLVRHHDRSRFQIHLLSDAPTPEALPDFDGEPGDRVHDVSGLDDAALAVLIRRLGIDLLVDLSAYSAPARLGLFLAAPAPVTVAWFNHYAPSGLPGLDYLVGDDEVAPPGDEPYFGETVLRLPQSYLSFEVMHPTPPVAPPPCVANGYLTFGSLVTQYKLTAPVLDAWGEILAGAPAARLLLGNKTLGSSCNRERVLGELARRGVAAERVTLLGRAPHLDFLAYYDRIDVALDAFPYNGGTTTMEALWQGVPVLCFTGDRWAARTSASLLRSAGLGEFIAADVEDYVERAVALARDPETPERLSSLRRGMRDALRASPVCDVRGLARHMEALYAEMTASR